MTALPTIDLEQLAERVAELVLVKLDEGALTALSKAEVLAEGPDPTSARGGARDGATQGSRPAASRPGTTRQGGGATSTNRNRTESSDNEDPWGPPPEDQDGDGGEDWPADKEPEPADNEPAQFKVETPFGVQYWTRNPPGGPTCNCGEPAGMVKAKGRDGKPYSAYRCIKKAGPDWRDECGFFQSIGRPRGKGRG